MSTNGIIYAEETKDVCLYKHWDGYPSGVLPYLKEFLPVFRQSRGPDPIYLMARLTGFFLDQQTKARKNRLAQAKRKKNKYDIDYYSRLEMTGFGIAPSNMVGGEFYYSIGPDFSVSVLDGDKKLLRKIEYSELLALNCPKYCDFDLATLTPIVKEKVKA